MSWFKESKRSFLETFAINVIKCGPIPAHIAFIMDGNRRFAKRHSMDSVFKGHEQGFDRLTEILSWCKDLDVKEVTVYAFSIENFKRNQQEVDDLLSLATDKFKELLKEKDKLRDNGIRIRIWGDTTLLPLDLRKLLAETVLYTSHHDKAFLNVCFAYTSRAEISDAINELVSSGIPEDLIDEEIFVQSFWSRGTEPPDLIVRTSGEKRLSDFLLWQTGWSVLAFVPKLWPEFSIWDLLKAVFYYQRHCSSIIESRQAKLKNVQRMHPQQELCLKSLEAKRLNNLQQLTSE